jgi:MFS family permease
VTSPTRHPLGWAPVLVVGIVCAVAAEVAIGLLLYTGPGFNRSLTTLLTVEALALAVGLRFPTPAPEIVDGLRRRWLLNLVAFLVATVFGTLWTVMPSLGSGRWGQGFGLAVLAGLPLYGCGALFSGLAGEASEQGSASGAGLAAVGTLGAALGFAATGFLLPRAPTPSSLLVGCLMLLSLGGMAYGIVRTGRPRRRLVAEGCAGPPPVRVEERIGVRNRGAGHAVDWVLVEGPIVRAVRSMNALPAGTERSTALAAAPEDGPWDVAAVLERAASADRGWRMLHVGGGASRAAFVAVRHGGAAEATVLERAHCVVDLGRSHFATEMPDQDAPSPAGLRVHVGNVGDAVRALTGPYDLVIVDGRMFDAIGGADAFSKDAREALARLVGPDGTMVWGPKAVHHPKEPLAPGWTASRRDRLDPLEEVLVLRREGSPGRVATSPEGGTTTS